MTKLQRSSVSFWLFFLLCPQCGTALDYYVDCTSGNDGNSGLSVEQPWRTIRKAASTVQRAGNGARTTRALHGARPHRVPGSSERKRQWRLFHDRHGLHHFPRVRRKWEPRPRAGAAWWLRCGDSTALERPPPCRCGLVHCKWMVSV